jgi:hypothetical protein
VLFQKRIFLDRQHTYIIQSCIILSKNLKANIDEVVKSPTTVIPAKAGIHKYPNFLDPGFRRGDEEEQFLTFCETVNIGFLNIKIKFKLLNAGFPF